MGKGVKIIALIASVLIFLGIIVTVTGLSLGGLNTLTMGPDGLQISYNDEVTGQINIDKRLQSFDEIEVKLNAYRIMLVEGDEYRVQGVSDTRFDAPYISVDNGVLKINEYTEMSGENSKWRNLVNRTFLNNSFFRWLVTPNKWGVGIPSITITYPKDKHFQNIDIKSAAATIQLWDVSTDYLQITCDAGDLRLYDTYAEKMRVGIAAGNFDIRDVTTGSSNISLSAGSFSATRYNCDGLTCNLDMGSADISGILKGNINVQSNMGSVKIYTDLPEDDYVYQASAVMGKVTINGFGGDGTMRGGSKDAANHIDAKANVGSVTINFAR